jgi:putative ABC transport system substrate-binding protein
MRRREFITLVSGVAATWPLAVRAHQPATPVVGFLSSTSAATYGPVVIAFREGLSETGYLEGQNLDIEYRWAEDRYDRLPAMAADLVDRKVDVIAAIGGLVSALAAKTATATIPIVFAMSDDPVSAGLVASFSRPGGNVTGVSFFAVELGPKLLELATELVPNASTIAMFANPNRPSYEPVRKAVDATARAKGRQLLIVAAGAESDFEPAFAALMQRQAGVVIVPSDPFFVDRRERLVLLAARHSMPVIYGYREFVAAGGLMSYGPSIASAYRQVGVYAGTILAGQRPADLPIVQPTKFELVINLTTARGLGIDVPAALLAQADEVIE